MNNTIPTAEELAYKIFFEGITDRKPNEDLESRKMYAKTLSKPIPSKDYGLKNGRVMEPHDTVKAMIEFARLHCEAQLKSILEKVRIYDANDTDNPLLDSDGIPYEDWRIDKSSIINAYPLNQIK
jgi:hypothetical protein